MLSQGIPCEIPASFLILAHFRCTRHPAKISARKYSFKRPYECVACSLQCMKRPTYDTCRFNTVPTRFQARDSKSQAASGGLQSLCWGSAAIGGIVSSYFSGALLERMTPREVFSLTAFLPLLITCCALFIDEIRKDTSLDR